MRKKSAPFFALITISTFTAILLSSCGKAPLTASSDAANSKTVSSQNSRMTSSVTANSVVISKEKLKKYQEMQDAEKDGHLPGLLNPEEVAMDFAADTLKITDLNKIYDKINKSITGDHATVTFQKDGKAVLEMNLYQPVTKGKSGIWAVTSWTDCKTNTSHAVE